MIPQHFKVECHSCPLQLIKASKLLHQKSPARLTAGRACLAAMITPTIFYFDVKARAEPLKVALSLKNVQYDYQVVPRESIKNFEEYPFGQAPRYKDDTIDMVQSNAILRHIGRK